MQLTSSADSGVTAAWLASTPSVKLSKSKLHTLQAQLTHCTQLLASATSLSPSSSTSSSSSILVQCLTTFLSNLLTLYTELAPHNSLPFDLIATRLVSGVYDLLSSSLQHPPIRESAVLPLLLQCVALFPLPLSSPDRLRLLCDVSGESVQRLVLDMAREVLDGVCMSAATVTARISNLSLSSLLLFTLYVRQLLQTADGAGSSVLVLLLNCAYQLLTAAKCGLTTDELSVSLRGGPSLSALPAVNVQLIAQNDRVAAHLTLCEHKQWVDWSLFTLVLPSLYQSTNTLPVDVRQQLIQLLAFYHSSSPTSALAVYDWIDQMYRTATEHLTLSTFFSAVSTTAGLLSSAPSTGLCVQLLLSFIPLYVPQKEEVSGYLSSLLSHFAPAMTLTSLLYHLLSYITLFLSTARYFRGDVSSAVSVVSGTFVVSLRSVSECWAHSLTCESSVPALKRQGVEEVQEKRIREYTRNVLNELRQLAVAGTVR